MSVGIAGTGVLSAGNIADGAITTPKGAGNYTATAADIYHENATERNMPYPGDIDYHLLKTTTLPADFPAGTTMQISYYWKSVDTGSSCRFKVYRNAIAVGTQVQSSVGTYTQQSESIAGWGPNDEINVYVASMGSDATAYVKDLEILGTAPYFGKYLAVATL